MDLREVWPYEANNFTPWLAENLSHLAEAIGIPLELEGTEIAVEGYSADILATYPADGSRVIIENQLESTDHTHLGQIMTYLAGGVGGLPNLEVLDLRTNRLTGVETDLHSLIGASLVARTRVLSWM